MLVDSWTATATGKINDDYNHSIEITCCVIDILIVCFSSTAVGGKQIVIFFILLSVDSFTATLAREWQI